METAGGYNWAKLTTPHRNKKNPRILAFVTFSTSDNAIVALWLVHCISVTSHFTYVWPYMKINAASANFFFVEAKFRRQKNGWEKTNSVSCLQKNIRNYEQCRPSNNEKDIKLTKLQNFKYEQLDFTRLWRLCNSNNFYLLMLLNGLQVLVAPNVWNR